MSNSSALSTYFPASVSMPRPLRRNLSTKRSDCSIGALRRVVSVQPYVPNSSSFVRDLGKITRKAAEEQSKYCTVGLNSCGRSSRFPRQTLRSRKDINAMWNDFNLINTVHNAIADTTALLQDLFPDRTPAKIPQCIEFLLPHPSTLTNNERDTNGHMF